MQCWFFAPIIDARLNFIKGRDLPVDTQPSTHFLRHCNQKKRKEIGFKLFYYNWSGVESFHLV